MSELRIEIRKLTRKDLYDIREETGRSVLAEIIAKKGYDEKMLSALAWVVRRRTEPDLTFDEVFSEPWSETEFVLDLGDAPSTPLSVRASMTRKRSRSSAASTTSHPAS